MAKTHIFVRLLKMLSSEKKLELSTHAFSIKKRFLGMYKKANAGHIGSSLSCAEIITFIFFDWMNEDDQFILSKGHAAACLYSVLAEKKKITQADIESFYINNTFLAAHPPPNKLPNIPFATGSLGHGLSLSAGLGLAQKFKNSSKKIFCVTSDGELNEGSSWEAAQFICHHNLTNVIWFIDKNNLQGFGSTESVLNPLSLKLKCEAFGFNVIEIDGHDFNEFAISKNWVESMTTPAVIICNTIKGRGWEAYENTLDCHYLPFKNEQFEETILNLESEFIKIDSNG